MNFQEVFMNLPTIIVLVIVAALFVAIIVNEIVKRKKGKAGCSCGCGGCAMKDVCHDKSKKQ